MSVYIIIPLIISVVISYITCIGVFYGYCVTKYGEPQHLDDQIGLTISAVFVVIGGPILIGYEITVYILNKSKNNEV